MEKNPTLPQRVVVIEKGTFGSTSTKIADFTFTYGSVWFGLVPLLNGGCPRGVMDCGIVVREFVLQSPYYVHFRANTLAKGKNPPYPPSYGLNNTTTVLLGEWLLALNNLKIGWYAIKQRNQTFAKWHINISRIFNSKDILEEKL